MKLNDQVQQCAYFQTLRDSSRFIPSKASPLQKHTQSRNDPPPIHLWEGIADPSPTKKESGHLIRPNCVSHAAAYDR